MEGNKSSTSVVNVVVVLLNWWRKSTPRITNLEGQFHIKFFIILAFEPMPLSMPTVTQYKCWQSLFVLILYAMTLNGTHHQLALPVVLQQGGGDWRRVDWRTNPSFGPACFTWRREYWRNTSSSFGPAGFTFAWLDWLLLNSKGGLLIYRLAVRWGLPINLYGQ